MSKHARQERLLQVLVRPLITEKTSSMQDDNRYGFEVAPDATKSEIKAAVESLFNVTVLKVNVLNQDGKVKFRGRVRGKRKDIRKAYVRLAAGDTIQYAIAA